MRQAKEPQIAFQVDMTLTRVAASPFVKWAGGKSQLLPQMARFFPDQADFARYFEPFLGGGAVFFHLQPSKALLSDSNAELIEVYRVVRDNVEELIRALGVHRNDPDYFASVRSQQTEHLTPVERASRFIYLNKTCYNGLYRVNSRGQFNVPFGRYKNPRICDSEALRAASMALAATTLEVADFAAALKEAGRSDFVYLDPPYHPLSTTSSFTGYTASGFGEREQRRLASVYREADERGALVMLSNSDTPLVRELYSGFRIVPVLANRAINCRGDRRGPITEVLVLNYV